MSDFPYTRALSTSAKHVFSRLSVDPQQVDFQPIAQHMYTLLLRNVASDGFPFTDSTHTLLSKPGCVIAAPSYPANAPGISQDYVFNWVRDAAITALEIAAATSAQSGTPVQNLIDYVTFAQICQGNAVPTKAHACFTVDGQARPWSEQNDGPAIQSIAILAAYDKLDAATQAVARTLLTENVAFLLQVYEDATTNLWEEHSGFSFFARSVQLRCLRELIGNTQGIPVPAGTEQAVKWLQAALNAHWDGTSYATMIGGDPPGQADHPVVPPGYDPNIDIVQACIYGAVPCTDTRLLATAAQLRGVWADADSPEVYPINLTDARREMGPMLGRYPGDVYDGGSGGLGDHPWLLCTANFAQLYCELAAEVTASGKVPLDELSTKFFAQVGVTATTTPAEAADALQAAADAMLQAVILHSDHLELSEQVDGISGYEKSVRNLTWSYAAFLSAVRARTGQAVLG
ncbi:MAG: glycoside hydrolase family 15 protein [Pseudonocardiaceae bacterium]